MRTFDKIAAQGDVMFIRTDKLPDGVVEVPAENGKNIVAHSETGHNHVIEKERGGVKTTMYRLPEEIYEAFLVVEGGDAVIEHERGFDTHESIQFPPGTYRVRRQREYTPEGYRRAAD